MRGNSAKAVARWIDSIKDTVTIESVFLSGNATYQADLDGSNKRFFEEEWVNVSVVLCTDKGRVEVIFHPENSIIDAVQDEEGTSTERRLRWGYALEENADRYFGSYASPNVAISDATKELPDDHEGPIYLARGREKDARDYFDEETIVQDIESRASELAEQDVGDAVEDFPDFSDEARHELETAIGRVLDRWVAKHVRCSFYSSDDIWRVHPFMHKPWDNAERVYTNPYEESESRYHDRLFREYSDAKLELGESPSEKAVFIQRLKENSLGDARFRVEIAEDEVRFMEVPRP